MKIHSKSTKMQHRTQHKSKSVQLQHIGQAFAVFDEQKLL